MEIKTAKDVTEAFEKASKSVSGVVQDYWMNCTYLEGNQWTFRNPVSNRIDKYEGDPERVQAVMNRLAPATRTTIAKLTQRELSFEVMPSKPDDATMRGASTAEAILHDIRLRHNWEQLRTINALGTWKGGTAAICVDWDPDAGGRVDEDTFEGDTCETALSIPEFVIEPGAKIAEKAGWWIKAQALPPEEVQSTYKLKDTPPADATEGVSYMQPNNRYSTDGERPRVTKVLTYYERPSNANPKGSVAVVVDGKFVDGPKPWPFPFKDHLNLALTYETDSEVNWWGSTVLTQARPIQVLLNLAESNIAEHLKNCGNSRMAVPQSSWDLAESFSDLPGEMFPIPDGMAAPQWVSPPNLPQWVSEWPQKLRDEIDDLLGVHDISRGAAPANIESGYGLSILAEHDSTPVGRMVKSEAEAWGRVATMVLELYASEVKETRKATIQAPGDVPEIIPWSGEELQGQTTAVVPFDAIMPRSRAAMQAMAEKMVQMGLVQDMETYAALVELPGQRDLLERSRPDAAKARRENGLMAIGRPELPDDFDDHQIHIMEHNVFRKSAKYDRLDPEARAIVDDHIQAHTTMAAELAGRSRQGAAIDPMLATVPQADSRPTIAPEQLPPEAMDEQMPGATAPPPPEDMLAMLAEASTNV